jgi:hypothetical protein
VTAACRPSTLAEGAGACCRPDDPSTRGGIIHAPVWSVLDLPPRSALLSLEPVGLGTPLVESMTSYLVRLASAHSLTTHDLLRYVIAPHCRSLVSQGRGRIDPRQFYQALQLRPELLMGMGEIATTTVSLLGMLTRRSSLEDLTAHRLSIIVGDRGLFREHAAWCTSCLRDWHETGSVLYEPLLWKFKSFAFCPIHSMPLAVACPFCGTSLPHLPPLVVSGHCPQCAQALCGDGLSKHSPLGHAPRTKWSDWTSMEVYDLMTTIQGDRFRLEQDRPGHRTFRLVCAADLPIEDIELLFRPQLTALWKRRSNAPRFTLDTLLYLCDYLGLDVRELIDECRLAEGTSTLRRRAGVLFVRSKAAGSGVMWVPSASLRAQRPRQIRPLGDHSGHRVIGARNSFAVPSSTSPGLNIT